MAVGVFPFGQPIRKVTQTDHAPKRVFVLGVYASVVHARWLDSKGKPVAPAIGVASEPYIFWRGEGAEELISAIEISPESGRLEPATSNLNGPSGRALDEKYLDPLGITRSDTWLCDLVPHSCMNPKQSESIRQNYVPRIKQQSLPYVDWPLVPQKLADEARRKEIEAELLESSAEVLITLGVDPLKWFARYFGAKHTLSAYGKEPESYGRIHDITIGSRLLHLIPLVHPRQAAGIPPYDKVWNSLHQQWEEQVAINLLNRLGS